MEKLTKEQADWLIEEIYKSEKSRPTDYELMHHPAGAVFLDNIRKIILQRAEKEFPNFEVYDTNKQLLLRIYQNEKEFVRLSNDVFWFDLDFNEFKKFTEGCNKIVEWIEAQ